MSHLECKFPSSTRDLLVLLLFLITVFISSCKWTQKSNFVKLLNFFVLFCFVFMKNLNVAFVWSSLGFFLFHEWKRHDVQLLLNLEMLLELTLKIQHLRIYW